MFVEADDLFVVAAYQQLNLPDATCDEPLLGGGHNGAAQALRLRSAESSSVDYGVSVTVRFTSKLVTATRDKDGEVVDGNPDTVTEVHDVWTFARETASNDPNWKLVATGDA